ncbi:hypothetical protein [Maricaulis sp.]|uniref:hypothetical protein n=1 Tax=Maricaulis sp. TaxID=1486257 RepID=UPI003A92D1BE
MIKIVLLIALAAVLAAACICKPDLLIQNTVLNGLMNHEVLALMSVILTVTLASVANIHLAINRVVSKKFGNNEKLIAAAADVKRELKDNSWYIFWGFLAALILVIAKGSIDNDTATAIIYAAVVWILGLYLLCMFDVYQVAFGVVDMDDGDGPPTA